MTALAERDLSARRAAPSSSGLDPRVVQRQYVASVRPWASEDLTRLLIFQGVAVVLVAASWWIVSGTGDLAKQMDWLRLGIVGVVLSGIANGVWLMRGRKVVGLARRYVLADLLGEAGPDSVAGVEEWVAVDGATRYHRAGCPLILGKATIAATRADHLIAGRVPCEACAE